MATVEKKASKRPAEAISSAAVEKKASKRPAEGGSSATASKKKRKRMHQNEQDEADFDVEAGLNKAFERMDGQLLADHLAQKTSRFGTDLSSVELSDLYISGEKASTKKSKVQ